MMQRCAPDFSGKRTRSRSRVLDFFQDSRIRVKLSNGITTNFHAQNGDVEMIYVKHAC